MNVLIDLYDKIRYGYEIVIVNWKLRYVVQDEIAMNIESVEWCTCEDVILTW